MKGKKGLYHLFWVVLLLATARNGYAQVQVVGNTILADTAVVDTLSTDLSNKVEKINPISSIDSASIKEESQRHVKEIENHSVSAVAEEVNFTEQKETAHKKVKEVKQTADIEVYKQKAKAKVAKEKQVVDQVAATPKNIASGVAGSSKKLVKDPTKELSAEELDAFDVDKLQKNALGSKELMQSKVKSTQNGVATDELPDLKIMDGVEDLGKGNHTEALKNIGGTAENVALEKVDALPQKEVKKGKELIQALEEDATAQQKSLALTDELVKDQLTHKQDSVYQKNKQHMVEYESILAKYHRNQIAKEDIENLLETHTSDTTSTAYQSLKKVLEAVEQTEHLPAMEDFNRMNNMQSNFHNPDLELVEKAGQDSTQNLIAQQKNKWLPDNVIGMLNIGFNLSSDPILLSVEPSLGYQWGIMILSAGVSMESVFHLKETEGEQNYALLLPGKVGIRAQYPKLPFFVQGDYIPYFPISIYGELPVNENGEVSPDNPHVFLIGAGVEIKIGSLFQTQWSIQYNFNQVEQSYQYGSPILSKLGVKF